MEISKELDGTTLTVHVSGRLNTATSPELEDELARSYRGIEHLIIDLKGLSYIASSGLRVFLGAQRVMKRQGTLVLRNAEPAVYEVFEMTGFSDFLTIE